MPNNITVGTVFIQQGTSMPAAARIESQPWARNWRMISELDCTALGKTVEQAGWNCFCIAGTIRSRVWGRGGDAGVRVAVRRILKKLGNGRFNCLEVVAVESKHFFGVPCMEVRARSWHIQAGGLLEAAA